MFGPILEPGGGSGTGGVEPITVNDGPAVTSGLLSLNIPREPNMPYTGIVPPQPMPLAVVADTSTFKPYPLNAAARCTGLCTGPDGNLWFADSGTDGVWRIPLSGTPTFFAIPGALLLGICTGPDGNLWAADNGTNRVWKITTAGVATAVPVGVGAAPSGACTGPDGNLWFGDTNLPAVWKVTPGGTVTHYVIPDPTALCITITAGPDGNLYFSDENNGANFYKVTTSGTFTVVYVGTSVQGACTGPDSNIWLVDGANVVRITPSGTATLFPTATPITSVVAGPDGNLWFSAGGSADILRVTPLGVMTAVVTPEVVTGVACIGPDGSLFLAASVAVSASLFGLLAMPFIVELGEMATTQVPYGPQVTVNDGPLISQGVAPVNAQRNPIVPMNGIVPPQPELFGFSFDGTIQQIFPIPAASNLLTGICFGPDHNLYLNDATNHCVFQLTPQGAVTQINLAVNSHNYAICGGPDGNVWTVDGARGSVWKITLPGLATTEIPLGGGGTEPIGVCTGPDGNIWVADDTGQSVWRVTPGGSVTQFTGLGGGASVNPHAIVAGPDGNLWFADLSGVSGGVWKITPQGAPTQVLNVGGSLGNLCVGPDNNIWATDGTTHVYRVTPQGVSTTFTLTSVQHLQFIVSGGGGDLWIIDIGAGVGHPAQLVKLTPIGQQTNFPLGFGTSSGGWICVGPDGAFWITMNTFVDGSHYGVIVQPFNAQFGQFQGRRKMRVSNVNAPGATPSMNTDTFDVFTFTGLAAAITSMTTNLTGTPEGEDLMRVSFTDNGVARAITWGASFESSTTTLPATTVAGARLDVGFVWNTATSKWRCLAAS
jgi:streptogramin lyase